MEHTYSIGDLAAAIDRKPHTIRGWERTGRLPVYLRGQRDDRDRRYWTHEQVLAIKQWMIDEDLRPGKGLASMKEPK